MLRQQRLRDRAGKENLLIAMEIGRLKDVAKQHIVALTDMEVHAHA